MSQQPGRNLVAVSHGKQIIHISKLRDATGSNKIPSMKVTCRATFM